MTQPDSQALPDELIGHFHLLTCSIGQSEINSGEVAFFESTFNFVGSDSAGSTTAVLSFEYLSVLRFRMYEDHCRIRLDLPRGIVDAWAESSGFSFSFSETVATVPFVMSFAPQDMRTFREEVATTLAAARARGRSTSAMSYASNGDGALPSVPSNHQEHQEEGAHVQQLYAPSNTPQQPTHQYSLCEDEAQSQQEHLQGSYDECGDRSQQHMPSQRDAEADSVPPSPRNPQHSAGRLIHEHAESPKATVLAVSKSTGPKKSKRLRTPAPASEEDDLPLVVVSPQKAAHPPPRGRHSAPRARSTTIVDRSDESDEDDNVPVTCFRTSTAKAPPRGGRRVEVPTPPQTTAKKNQPVQQQETEDTFDFDVAAFASKEFGATLKKAPSSTRAAAVPTKKAPGRRSASSAAAPNKTTKQPVATKKAPSPPSHRGNATVRELEEDEDFTPRRSQTAPPPTTMPRGVSRNAPASAKKQPAAHSSAVMSKPTPPAPRVDTALFPPPDADEGALTALLASGLSDDDHLDTFLGSALALVQKRRMSRHRAESVVNPNTIKMAEAALRGHTASTTSHRSSFIKIHAQRISKLEEVLSQLSATQDQLRATLETGLNEIASVTSAVIDALAKTKLKLSKDEEKWMEAENEELESAIHGLSELCTST